eukprot:gnl/TRDRNA2_/TRDRNA2_197286_c0_seq1.p1 gnl/TRDRNA2_/TRDRNA2_197286_c0~~gnl/TRDRNA2_/TRDRNA2_197286_c0_seq1.p1  ORF type:complete len:360 (+),score=53.58 gnl/TRDRNA2_/TRDRNA2_197286_c0_seq1:105-1184(+)
MGAAETRCCEPDNGDEQLHFQTKPLETRDHGMVFEEDYQWPSKPATPVSYDHRVCLPGKPLGGWEQVTRSDRPLPPAENDNLEGWVRTNLLHSIEGGHMFNDGSVSFLQEKEMPWVYMKVNGWTIELWQRDRYSAIQVEHDTPVAWYDSRRILDIKCERNKSQEAADCDYELQIVYTTGMYKLRFPSFQEMHAWQTKLSNLVRSNYLVQGGQKLVMLDELWIDILNKEEDNVDDRMKEIFEELDENKNGATSSSQCTTLIMQCFEHRKMFLKEHDMRCHALVGTESNQTTELLNEYERRIANYMEINNWLCVNTAEPGAVRLNEFKVLVSQCLFPERLLELEGDVWHSPKSKAKFHAKF